MDRFRRKWIKDFIKLGLSKTAKAEAKERKAEMKAAVKKLTKTIERKIEAGEALLEGRGFPVSRVRHHGRFARLEVPPEKLSHLRDQETEITGEFQELGFENIEIDPEGFVSGKLNRAL